MSRYSRSVVIACCGVCCLLAGFWGEVGAQVGGSSDGFSAAGSESRASRKQSLAALGRQLEELSSQLERVSAQADDVVGRVARVRRQLEIQRLRVRQAQGSLAQAMEEVGQAERELARLEVEHSVLLEHLEGRAATLYRVGRWGYLRMFFSLVRGSAEPTAAGVGTSDRFVRESEDALAGIRLLRAVVKMDAANLNELRVNRRLAEQASAELGRKREAARTWLDRQRRIGARLEAREREEQVALAALRQRREGIESQLAGTKNRRDRLNRLLEILSAEGDGGLGGLAIEEFKGALDWPARGTLLRKFGPYRDRQYGTLVPHNGVTIAPRSGTLVRAVYPGRVVYSGQFRDVGLVVVVQHRGGALTMYSGLRNVRVGEGDVVSLGQHLGVALRELYFEIRIQSRPEDPLKWLN